MIYYIYSGYVALVLKMDYLSQLIAQFMFWVIFLIVFMLLLIEIYQSIRYKIKK